VRGDLLVLASSETFRSIQPEGELYLGENPTPWVVDSLRPHQGRYIVHRLGCDDRSAAEELRGLEVRLALEGTQPLPAGTYYRWQILELQVIDQAGVPLGTVSEIIETGANDVYVIQRTDQRDLLLPAIESVILKVDLEGGRLIVNVPEGLDSPA
jgi:16S rRNA processing protein RimM